MIVTLELPDDMPPVQVEEAKRVVEDGAFIALRRPPAMTNEECATFCTAAVELLKSSYPGF